MRLCGKCKCQIGKRHKWHFEGPRAVHDICSNPELKTGQQDLFSAQRVQAVEVEQRKMTEVKDAGNK